MSLENARVSDKTYADKRMEDIQPKELIIRDLGYYSIDSYKKIEDQKAFYISRLKAQIAIYDKTDKGYLQLNWPAIIALIKKAKKNVLTRLCILAQRTKSR